MARPSSRSSTSRNHYYYNGRRAAVVQTTHGYPFDEEYSGMAGVGGRNCNNTDDYDDDDSSVVDMRPSRCGGPSVMGDYHNRRRHHRLGGILDAISCLCIGNFDANDYIHNDESIDDDDDDDGIVTPKKSIKTPTSSSGGNFNFNSAHHNNNNNNNNSKHNNKRLVVQPVAIVADQVTGELLERRAAQRTRSGSSSFPAGRFVFRPVSDDETTVTGFNSQISRGWEI